MFVTSTPRSKRPEASECRPQARAVRGGGFAFDHARIVADAYLLVAGGAPGAALR